MKATRSVSKLRELLSMSVPEFADLICVSERQLRGVEGGEFEKSPSCVEALMGFFSISHERASEMLYTDTLSPLVVKRLAKTAFSKHVDRTMMKWGVK